MITIFNQINSFSNFFEKNNSAGFITLVVKSAFGKDE